MVTGIARLWSAYSSTWRVRQALAPASPPGELAYAKGPTADNDLAQTTSCSKSLCDGRDPVS